MRRDTDQAMRLLVQLAERGPGACVAVRGLAGGAGVRVAVAHKCVQKLRHAGMLACRRGRAGGVTLAKGPGSIGVLDVVTAIQGRPALCRCLVEPGACPRQAGCRLSGGMAPLQARLEALLGSTTLADLASAASATRRGAGRRQDAGGRQGRRIGT